MMKRNMILRALGGYIHRWLSFSLIATFLLLVGVVYGAGEVWDLEVTLDDDNNVTSGDINEFTINIVNNEIVPPGYDDSNTQVVVTLPGGLVFFAEGALDPVFAPVTLVSTGGGILVWDIADLFSLDDIDIGYQVQVTTTGSLLTNVEVIAGSGSPAELGTGNNSYNHTIIAVDAAIDGVCGSDDGQTYYSGYTFTQACDVGVLLPDPPNFSYASGWDRQCLSPNGGSNDACTANVRYCGDLVNDPEEQCDTGVADDLGTCFSSGSVVGSACTFTYCGDTIHQTANGAGTGGTTNSGDEECDDGANGDDSDGCTDSCTLTYCGDSIVQNPNGVASGGATGIGDEECDDGADGDSADGCNDSCQVTFNGICGSDDGSSIYDSSPDGSNLSSGSVTLCSGSVATGFVYDGTGHSRAWTCLGSANGGSDASCGAIESYCGDASADLGDGESCDDGADGDDSDGCNDSCEIVGVCGSHDGSDLYDVDGDGSMLTGGSTNLCTFGTSTGFIYSGTLHDRSWTCAGSAGSGTDSTCGASERYCGDTTVDLSDGETCDDGNILTDDGCSAVCQWEVPSCTVSIAPGTGFAPLAVTSTPSFDSWAVVQSMDWLDGTVNTSSTHTYVTTGSFMAELTVANQFNGSVTNTCTDLVQVNTECGNGLLEIGEQCDDGNIIDGDGCTASCRDEYCGDAIVNDAGAETCDDGNMNNFDACPNDCQLAVCGDGIKEGGEACDDGNGIEDDSCTSSCTLTAAPRYFGSSFSSSVIAETQSSDDETEKEEVTNNALARLQWFQQMMAETAEKEHSVAEKSLSIREILQQRNISLRDTIKQRNLIATTLVHLRSYLAQRNASLITAGENIEKQEHASAPVVSPRPIAVPVPQIDPVDKKAALRAALAKYHASK